MLRRDAARLDRAGGSGKLQDNRQADAAGDV